MKVIIQDSAGKISTFDINETWTQQKLELRYPGWQPCWPYVPGYAGDNMLKITQHKGEQS